MRFAAPAHGSSWRRTSVGDVWSHASDWVKNGHFAGTTMLVGRDLSIVLRIVPDGQVCTAHKPYRWLFLKHFAMMWPTVRPSSVSRMSHNNPSVREEESLDENAPDSHVDSRLERRPR